MKAKAAVLREALSDGQAHSCRDLEAMTGIPRARIIPILDWDIKAGRIERIKEEDSPVLLQKADLRSFQIERAIRFLKSCGYNVTDRKGEAL
jgi:hypothetical protein